MELTRKVYLAVILLLLSLIISACSDQTSPANSSNNTVLLNNELSSEQESGPNTPQEQDQSLLPIAAANRGDIFLEHQITDPGMNNMLAGTFLMPEGWSAEGGLSRLDPQFYSTPVMLDLKFIAPDGRQVRFYPSFSFEFNQQNSAQPFSPTGDGNMYLPLPESVGAWVQQLFQFFPDPNLSNFQFISEEEEIELTQQVRQQNAQSYQFIEQSQDLALQTGFGSAFDTQATKVVIRYTMNNIELEETFLIVWQYFLNSWQGQVTGGFWSVSLMVSMAGPVATDYINDPQMSTIVQSARTNPAWQAEMNNYWQQLAQIRQQGQRDRQQQAVAAQQRLTQTYNETSDIIANGWSSRNRISDAGQQRYVDSINEVTPYSTPTGSTVRLPSFYDNVYTDGNGRYLLNNDALYNPNTDPLINNSSWQKMNEQ